MSALPKAPRDLRINQRLAALHTRAGRFGEAAVCCRNLEQLYHDAGHPDEASRYSDLAGKYEERTSAKSHRESDATAAKPFAPATMAPPAFDHFDTAEAAEAPAFSSPEPLSSGLFFHQPGSPAAPASSEFEIRSEAPAPENEIDISAEWDGEVAEEPKAAAFADEPNLLTRTPIMPGPRPSRKPSKSFASTSRTRWWNKPALVFAKLEKLKPGAAQLAAVWQEIEAAETQTSSKPPK